MKSRTFTALLLCSLLATQTVFGQVNPAVKGVGVVVKKNPGSGASRVVTNGEGSGSVDLSQGNYSISLDQATLLRAGGALVKQTDPKSSYTFNGDGTQVRVAPDKGIKVSTGADKGLEDVINVTVTAEKATLKFTVTWDPSVMKQDSKGAGKIGHITLIK